MKQSSKKIIIKEIANESKEKIIPIVRDNINNTIQKSYFDLMHGKGVKSSNPKRLNKHLRQLLKIITK